MNEDQFSAMLTLIVPPIIEQIAKNSNVDENEIIHIFYHSFRFAQGTNKL